MTTKHTPGPWFYGASSDSFAVANAPIAEGRVPSGSVWVALALPSRDAARTDANARLIAAAPDLLAALREIVEVFNLHGAGFLGGKVEKAARTAIERATGGAS